MYKKSILAIWLTSQGNYRSELLVFYTEGYETTWMVPVSRIMVLHLHVFLFFFSQPIILFISPLFIYLSRKSQLYPCLYRLLPYNENSII